MSKSPGARTFATTFATVEPCIPSQLVDADARHRLMALAPAFPASLTDGFYLECSLGAGASRTDLILEVRDTGRGILAGENPAISMDRSLSARPLWAALGELCRRWIAQRDDLHRQVKRIWLELDLEAGSERQHPAAAPRVFVDWVQPLSAAHAQWAIATLLEEHGALAGQPPAEDLKSALRECLESLPDAMSVYSVGFFPERTAQAVRLCLRGTEDQHLEYLRKVGRFDEFPCRLVAGRGETPEADAPRKRIMHLDVNPSGGSKIGLEIGLRRLRRQDLLVSPFLDCLVESGLCTPARRAGLAAWPGGREETFAHELWPSLAVRWVNHVKVTVSTAGVAQAKAYLCHRHVPRVG